jgi:large subunit ribosomal protein L24
MEAGIHISNVALVDPSTKKPTRMGSKLESVTKGGKTKTVRTRVSVKSGKEI